MVDQIGEALGSAEWHPVDAPDPKSFTDGLLESVQRAGVELVTGAANQLVRDPRSLKVLLKVAGLSPQPTELADRVAKQITPSDGAGRPTLGQLALASALLLTVGGVVPFIAPAAEIILTNEVAILAIVISVAPLIKEK